MLSPTPVTKTTSGSATGNPRNKCALKPGHSLMDWIRLGNSGVDLTGFQGRTVSISMEELSKHNKQNDAWLAIRGNVYNVTRYMDFHPGGVEELMRGVGRDATKLFDEVHAWVNYQQLLKHCYIGPLKNVVKIDKNLLTALKNNTKSANSLGLPPLPPAEIIPRFDWTQRKSDLTLYFYTKQDCNPGFSIHHKATKQLNINIQLSNVIHQFKFDFHADIQWPPKAVHVNSETGKIEINLNKNEEALWTTYGTHLVAKLQSWSLENDLDNVPYSFQVVSNEKFNHNSFELCLKSANDIIIPAIGYHFTISAAINGQSISRDYTPVSIQLIPRITQKEVTDYFQRFLIKSYGNSGQLSTYLSQLELGAALQLSLPKGGFQTKTLQNRKYILLLAAGSGITPCLSLLQHVLNCRSSKVQQILLVYFNKTEADIWCRAELERLVETDERLRFVNVLSQPTTDWAGAKGHLSTALLIDLLEKKTLDSYTFVGICGPNGFNSLAETCLKELKCKDDDFHIFQG